MACRPLRRLWQEEIREVKSTGPKTFHWTLISGDKTIEWDSEILNDEPGKRITWRSVQGESDNAGEVIFERDPGDRGTVVTILQEFKMSKLTSVWETLTGRNPKQAVIENLRHSKPWRRPARSRARKDSRTAPVALLETLRRLLMSRRYQLPRE